MYDIIIVGAGPAGLTAAIFARRARKNVLVLEARTYGGQIITSSVVENYPGERKMTGADFATKLYNQAKDLGAEVVFEKVTEITPDKEVITTNNRYKAKAIILATGSDHRKLGIEGEDYLVGKGLSYCATCDGAFFRNKPVAVAGGGDTAVEESLYLSDIASKVYLIHRSEELNGDSSNIDALKSRDNIEIIHNSNITKLVYDNLLSAIEVTNKDGEVRTIDINGLFIAVGRVPENQNFSKLVNLDEAGYIIASEDCKTNVDGIFVAGDNRTKSLRQLVTATSDGAMAATNAIKYINNL